MGKSVLSRSVTNNRRIPRAFDSCVRTFLGLEAEATQMTLLRSEGEAEREE
jgi:hypothetical protein